MKKKTVINNNITLKDIYNTALKQANKNPYDVVRDVEKYNTNDEEVTHIKHGMRIVTKKNKKYTVAMSGLYHSSAGFYFKVHSETNHKEGQTIMLFDSDIDWDKTNKLNKKK